MNFQGLMATKKLHNGLKKRFKWEHKKHDPMKHQRVTAEQTTEDPFVWKCTIKGGKDTPYEGGIFTLQLTFPRDYPFKPPKLKWLTKIFHPTFKENGTKFCLDRLSNNWSPAYSIWSILLYLAEFLDILCGDIPSLCCGESINESIIKGGSCWPSGVEEAAKLYFKDRNAFNQKAKQWTQRYATPELRIYGYLRSESVMLPVCDIACIVSKYFGPLE